MKLGKIKILFIFFLVIPNILAQEQIKTSPLINLDNLEPSFEEEEKIESEIKKSDLKIKTKLYNDSGGNFSYVKLKGLDKITAKTNEIKIKLGEKYNLGILEIKAVKCGETKSLNLPDHVAYIQVKDNSDKSNEKVFIFNGWTFASNPSLNPIDHAIYDIWLVECLKS